MTANQLVSFVILLITSVSCNEPKAQPVSAADQPAKRNSSKIVSEVDDVDDQKIKFDAKVIGIIDGDTAEILYHELPLRIRMEHIDAPEKRGSQPFGNKAKSALSGLCFGEMVTIVTEGHFDMGGRLIAVIYNTKGQNVNMEMVRLGYAWHFKKYSTDMTYDHLEMEARKARRGLWQDKNPVAPWDFRQR